MALPDGTVVRLATVPTRSTSPPAVRALVEARGEGDEVPVVVADRVSAQLAELLNDIDAGWLDRRGHLRLVQPGVVIDTDVPSMILPSSRGARLPDDPCATPVGREVALELLVAPREARTVRGLARALGRGPSSVSAVLRALRAQGLVDAQRRPCIPELFWALSASWRPQRYCLRSCPDPSNPDDDWSYELHATDLEIPGWALGDTLGAVGWGAPLIASSDDPPDLYVPNERQVLRAMQRFGESAAVDSRACTLAVAPAPSVCARRFHGPGPWPLTHPVVVALDLAADRGRGSEASQGGIPPNVSGDRRVLLGGTQAVFVARAVASAQEAYLEQGAGGKGWASVGGDFLSQNEGKRLWTGLRMERRVML